ncbi:hypothetical protein [Paracoccus sediminicola]|nr:hypothetical protein [Paracoccus sediminicola]WBU58591.1 hypothetical protein PAF18_15950 [Paracoccus sediminicola]
MWRRIQLRRQCTATGRQNALPPAVDLTEDDDMPRKAAVGGW